MELTAKQIKELDEFQLDTYAIEKTLEIALTYHSNKQNQLKKREKSFWDELVKQHNLDPAKPWKVSNGIITSVIEDET